MSDVHVSEPFWLRQDLHVFGVALLVLIFAWAFRAETGGTPSKRVSKGPVSVAVPAGWLAEPSMGETLVVRGEDALTRVEIRVTERPESGLVSLDAALELERGRQYGELYQRSTSDRQFIGRLPVLRTVFAYAFKPTPSHAPRVAGAVEYAFPPDAAGPLYMVTVHGPEARIPELEKTILSTIEVAQ